MNTVPRSTPRFVPTLTEVVDPAKLAQSSLHSKTHIDAVVELVQQQIQPYLERRLQEKADRLVRTLLIKHMAEIDDRIRQELDLLVREAVIAELNEQTRS